VRLLIDECVARPLAEALRERFGDVVYVGDVSQGAPDRDVLEQAVREKRVLVTEDYDFGELVFRRGLDAEAVVIVAPGVLGVDLIDNARHVADRIFAASDRLPGHLTIVEPKRLRQRRLSVRR
jgi:predicted nuclease of predicted toxin-antitoxin system